MTQLKHQQDRVNTWLGAWLILSPWAVGFNAEQLATWNFVTVGSLLLVAALGSIFAPKAWQEWAEVGLGAWLVASPWMLGFTHVLLATQNAVFTGLVVMALSLWVLTCDEDYAGWWHRMTRSIRLP